MSVIFDPVKSLFDDLVILQKIQKKLPEFFEMVEIESSRAGKVGMEVGSLRERVIIALFIYKFGEKAVKVDIPITEPEIDVIVYDVPYSIKTITGRNISGVKLIWTVDQFQAREFSNKYLPKCGMILIHINWENEGAFYYIPKDTQIEIFRKIKPENYFRLPKEGTNPRGVELSAVALREMLQHRNTYKIPIFWRRQNITFNVYQKWIDLWKNP